MCSAALAADVPHDGADFFRKFIIELDPEASPEALAATLTAALPQWPTHAKLGLALTATTCLQEHYAHEFLNVYEEMAGATRPTLRAADIVDGGGALPLHDASVVVSNHCWWLPHIGVKVPRQHNGVLSKNVVPPEPGCSMSSMAVEYTIMKRLSDMGAAPPVGRVVRFTRGGGGESVFGYEIADATTLPPGPVLNIDVAREFLARLPMQCSRGALTDAARNVVNGYLVDARRSAPDMYRWTNPDTLFRIPGVNMLQRRVLMVCDVPGWAWHRKALAIKAAYRGAATIHVCFSNPLASGGYADAMLPDYDHVHFFGWRSISKAAKERSAQGLLVVSTTIASIEHTFTEDIFAKARKATDGVHVVAVSPYLVQHSTKHLIGAAGVHACFNGVDTQHTFRPPPTAEPPAPPARLKVLICPKPSRQAYDIHGLLIAQRLAGMLDPSTFDVTVHVSKHTTANLVALDDMEQLYGAHDVFVHTGRHHLGTPNMAFEAAACGLAIVSTANGCLPALFEGASAPIGRLVALPSVRPLLPNEEQDSYHTKDDMRTAVAMAQQLFYFAKNRDVCAAMGASARAAVVDKWSWSQRAQDYASVFDARSIR
jgi:glycosyltransferase involved in cell wall biosynthesis